MLSDSPLASTSLALAFLLADLVLTLGYLALTLGYPLMVPISVGHTHNAAALRLCGFEALRLLYLNFEFRISNFELHSFAFRILKRAIPRGTKREYSI